MKWVFVVKSWTVNILPVLDTYLNDFSLGNFVWDQSGFLLFGFTRFIKVHLKSFFYSYLHMTAQLAGAFLVPTGALLNRILWYFHLNNCVIENCCICINCYKMFEGFWTLKWQLSTSVLALIGPVISSSICSELNLISPKWDCSKIYRQATH